MTPRRRRHALSLAVLGIVGALLLMQPPVNAADPVARFTAMAANLSNIGTGRTARVDIRFTRWTTDEEREKLRTTLVEKGTEAVYDVLRQMKPVGSISVNSSVGWDLRYSRDIQEPGGKRRIVFATDRPIGTAEAMNSTRSLQYKFTMGELNVDASGKGEGSLTIAVKARWNPDGHVLELENFASQPVRLLSVRPL